MSDLELLQGPEKQDIPLNYVAYNAKRKNLVQPLLGKKGEILQVGEKNPRQLALQPFVPDEALNVSNSSLLISLTRPEAGPLPQVLPWGLATVSQELQDRHWAGFVAYSPTGIGDLDVAAYLLSRSGCGARLSAQDACSDLLTPALGIDVRIRFYSALENIERAAFLLEVDPNSFASPEAKMVARQLAIREPVSPGWLAMHVSYANAVRELERARSRLRTDPQLPAERPFRPREASRRKGPQAATSFLDRYLCHCQFAHEYLNCVLAIRRAATARANQDRETELSELQFAKAALDQGLQHLASNDTNPSEQGAAALIHARIRTPLVKEIESLKPAP